MLGDLFPDDVMTAWGDPLEPATPLFPEEEALVASAIEKRKREFAKGRECARAALSRLGLRDVIVLSGESREPLWPSDVVGSITHTAGLCAAAVAHSERYAGIGIDAEPAEPLAADLARRVCTSGEAEALAELSALDAALAARLVFSAKESLYKCLFPITRAFLGFSDVRVTLENGALSAELVVASPPFRAGSRFRGRFRRAEAHLVTAIWAERALEVRALDSRRPRLT